MPLKVAKECYVNLQINFCIKGQKGYQRPLKVAWNPLIIISLNILNFAQNVKKADEGHLMVAQVNLWVKLINCYLMYSSNRS